MKKLKSRSRGRPHPSVQCLFVDIGGVLLTDGWDHQSRKRAARHFHLDYAEMESKHRVVFDTYEQGRLTMDDYLNWVIFHEKRSFSRKEFRDFIFAQSVQLPKMIPFIKALKERFRLKVVVVNNEAREINDYRIQHFRLAEFVDAFVSSCFVHLRKPDPAIFKLALDLAQVKPANVVYLENTELFIGIAENLGIRSVLHTSFESTREQLSVMGLEL